MDPPWPTTSNNQIQIDDIFGVDIPSLQENGFLFIWVTNQTLMQTMKWLEDLNYEIMDELLWIKPTSQRSFSSTVGFYLRHSYETCLVAMKGDPLSCASFPKYTAGVNFSVISEKWAEPYKKPSKLYKIIEELVPNGAKLELFARLHNLRSLWISVGIELSKSKHIWTIMRDEEYLPKFEDYFSKEDLHYLKTKHEEPQVGLEEGACRSVMR